MVKRVKWLKGLEDKEKREYFECDCHGDLICLDDWFDNPTKKDPKIQYWNLCFTLFNLGSGYNKNGIPFRSKLKCIWQILRGIGPWADSIILTPDKAKKLAYKIMEKTERAEKLMDEYNKNHG